MSVDKSITDRIVEVYKSYLGENLVSIVLFGSQARGDATPKSDYDLFIVARDLPSSWLERSRFIHRPMYEYRLPDLSIVAKTPEEFARDVTPLLLNISVEGTVLYDTDFAQPKLQRLREIIKKAGLKRVRDKNEFHWEWDRYPRGEWEITWDGFREL